MMWVGNRCALFQQLCARSSLLSPLPAAGLFLGCGWQPAGAGAPELQPWGEHLLGGGGGDRKTSLPGPAVTSCGWRGCLGVSSQFSVVMNAKVGKGVWILLSGCWKRTAIPGVRLLPCWSCDVVVSEWLWSNSDCSLPLVNPQLASEPTRGAGRSESRTWAQVPFPWQLLVSAKSCLTALAQNWELWSTMPASWLWYARRAGGSQPLVIT